MRYNKSCSGRSSVWLERYLGVVEAARSSRVAPTSWIQVLERGFKNERKYFLSFFYVIIRRGESDFLLRNGKETRIGRVYVIGHWWIPYLIFDRKYHLWFCCWWSNAFPYCLFSVGGKDIGKRGDLRNKKTTWFHKSFFLAGEPGFEPGNHGPRNRCLAAWPHPYVLNCIFWSGRQDLNLRPPDPKSGALPNCATSRCPVQFSIAKGVWFVKHKFYRK